MLMHEVDEVCTATANSVVGMCVCVCVCVCVCHFHRCDIAMVLKGGGSRPRHMHRCVTQTSGDAIVVQDS